MYRKRTFLSLFGTPASVMQGLYIPFVLFFCLFTGCGTTKWSDTSRTATEQLLISNAIDRAVDKVDFSPLCNRKCFIKTTAIASITDHDYMSMTLRQQVAAAGAILSSEENDADYIIEVRSGGVGTDRDEFLIGIPALTLPSIPGSTFSGSVIPEIPFIKRTRQRGTAKLALFAYNKSTGKSIWSSGNNRGESSAQNIWVGGLGPIVKGTIYNEMTFAGSVIPTFFGDSGQNGAGWMEHPLVYPETVAPATTPQPPPGAAAPVFPPANDAAPPNNSVPFYK